MRGSFPFQGHAIRRTWCWCPAGAESRDPHLAHTPGGTGSPAPLSFFQSGKIWSKELKELFRRLHYWIPIPSHARSWNLLTLICKETGNMQISSSQVHKNSSVSPLPSLQNQNCWIPMPFLFPSCSLPLNLLLPCISLSVFFFHLFSLFPYLIAPISLSLHFLCTLLVLLPSKSGCERAHRTSFTRVWKHSTWTFAGILRCFGSLIPMLVHQDDKEAHGLARKWPWAGSSTHGNVYIGGLLGTYEAAQMPSSEKLNWPTITSHYSQR